MRNTKAVLWNSPGQRSLTLPVFRRSFQAWSDAPALCRLIVFALCLAVALSTAARAQSLPAGYVGSEACAICHEDISKALTKSPHNAVQAGQARGKSLGFQGRACEACHGPGEMHAGSADASLIRNPAKLAPGDVDKTCLTCHRNQSTHSGRLESGHAKDAVACTSCHRVHADGGNALVARKPADVNRQCEGCHKTVAAAFQRPNHHKVPENAMTCVDCHNPHGSARPAMAQSFASNEPGCLNCHGDKRGPFTFEHPPVRFEGCSTCHEPHGSSNPRMLVRHEVRTQCLECHANLPTTSVAANVAQPSIGVVPPAFHDLRSPRYQNCTVCHQKIHGSYADRNLLR